MSLKRAARRAAGIALVSSLYIIYLCLHHVAGTAQEAAAWRTESAAVARAGASGAAARLFLLVPLFLVLPLSGWAMVRRLAGGDRDAAVLVGVVRTATLIAVAVWVVSIAFLRFALPAACGWPPNHPVSDESGYLSVRCHHGIPDHPFEDWNRNAQYL